MGFCAILLGIYGDFAEGGEFQSGQTGSIFVRDGDQVEDEAYVLNA